MHVLCVGKTQLPRSNPALLNHEFVHCFVQTQKKWLLRKLCTPLDDLFMKIEDNICTEKIVDLYAESGETSSLPNQGKSNPKRPTTVMWP